MNPLVPADRRGPGAEATRGRYPELPLPPNGRLSRYRGGRGERAGRARVTWRAPLPPPSRAGGGHVRRRLTCRGRVGRAAASGARSRAHGAARPRPAAAAAPRPPPAAGSRGWAPPGARRRLPGAVQVGGGGAPPSVRVRVSRPRAG